MKNKEKKYFAEIVELPNKVLKVKLAKRYTIVNQHVTHWLRINARNLARELNRGKFLIK